MKFSLIVCTYMRPKAIATLLDSVEKQLLYPNEIIIVDGSRNDDTLKVFKNLTFKKTQYYKVDETDRGLTKQRNFGISKVSKDMEIVCFLDDDIVLTPAYFKNLIGTYAEHPNTSGVGGYIINNEEWRKLTSNESVKYTDFECDGWVKKMSLRKLLRKKLGLLSKDNPCIMPIFSNGFPVSSFPPSNATYCVEYFLGGVSSFKKEIVDTIQFSTYFDGYGLYEDMEYCLRVSRAHTLRVNTSAKLYHHHKEEGRPNKFAYGKMVIQNGWYVWRTKYKNPSLIVRFKWNAIALLLIGIRFGNVFSSPKKREALFESFGRMSALCMLIFIKPKIIH